MRGSNWDLLEDPKVRMTVSNAARFIADKNVGIVEYEDMLQEGLVLVATVDDIAQNAIAGQMELVHNGIRQRLYNTHVRPMVRTGELDSRRTSASYEEADEPALKSSTFNNVAVSGFRGTTPLRKDGRPEVIAEW